MPTVLRVDGFQFFFFANDHPPKHVHVLKGDAYAKIDFVNGFILDHDMGPSDLKKVLRLCKLNQKLVEEAWDEWFENR